MTEHTKGLYDITSMDIHVIIEAPSRQVAIREFWARVRENGWGKQLGVIGLMKMPGWRSDDDTVPFKTYPTLLNMKLIGWDEAIDSLAQHIGYSPQEAAKVLSEAVEKDKWMMPAEAIDLDHDWKGRPIK